MKKELGYGCSLRSIVGSATLVLVSLFYIYSAASFFKLNIYILHNRISYNTYFEYYIVNEYADHLIIVLGMILWIALSLRGNARIILMTSYSAVTAFALTNGTEILLDIVVIMAIPFVICSLIFDKLALRKILNINSKLFINYLAVFVIALSIIGIVTSLETLYIQENLILPIPNYIYEIFLPFSSFSPILVLLLVSSLPVKVLINAFVETDRFKKIRIYQTVIPSGNVIRLGTKIIYLTFFALLSILLVLIPHQPLININKDHVGVDTHYYIDWVSALLHSSSPKEFLYQAFVVQSTGDRPITLIFLFAISHVIPTDLVNIIEYTPLILGPSLIFVVYLLTRELTSDDLASIYAAFLTVVSFQTLIGIYAGFYSNWLAIVIGYLSYVFLIRFLKNSSPSSLALYSVCIMIMIFAHVYTWSIFLIATGIFLAVIFKLNYYSKRNIFLLSLVLFASFLVDVAKFAFTGSSSGIGQDMIIASAGGLGWEQFVLRWSNLVDIVQNWYGVQYSNFIILILGIVWLWFSDLRKQVHVLIMIFLSLGLATTFLGTPAIQGRILYDIPFQIPAAITLSYVNKIARGHMLALAFCVWLVAISVRAVFNFHFD
jgi:hypothetical protein